MRLVAMILLVLLSGFVGVMGYYWMRDGSPPALRADSEKARTDVERTTQARQDSSGEVGDAAE
jgi:hypothetical protein